MKIIEITDEIKKKGLLKFDDDKLRIIPIGTGSAFTTKYGQTNLLVVKGNSHIMIDVGMTAPYMLNELGIQAWQIKNVIITHSHPDHIGGLGDMALRHRYIIPFLPKNLKEQYGYENDTKLNIVAPNMFLETILWDRTLRGGLEWCEANQNRPLSFADFFNLVTMQWKSSEPREIWTTIVDGIKISLFRTNHMPGGVESWEKCFPTFGVIIDDIVFYTSDSIYDVDLIEYFRTMELSRLICSEVPEKYEMLIHDAQLFHPQTVHASILDLDMKIEAELKKRMWLIHYGDNLEEFRKEKKLMCNTFGGFIEKNKIYEF